MTNSYDLIVNRVIDYIHDHMANSYDLMADRMI